MDVYHHRPGRKCAVVSGASGGVGRATAIELARRGYCVALIARGRAGLEGAALEVRKAGGRAVTIEADVADYEAVEAAGQRAQSELGEVEVWVNNAMATVFGSVRQIRPDEFRRATEVTYLGQVYGTLVALQLMSERDSGSIVNVGSALAFVGIPLQAPYCASKFACRGFYQSVRAELLHEKSGISIAMVHLPAVNTPQFSWSAVKTAKSPRPVAPVYPPERAARRIADVAESRRTSVLGTWNKLLVAAASVMPGVAVRYGAKSAVSGQLTHTPVAVSRRQNLLEPADDTTDYGTTGDFTKESLGVFDPKFLRSLPNVAKQLTESVVDAIRTH